MKMKKDGRIARLRKNGVKKKLNQLALIFETVGGFKGKTPTQVRGKEQQHNSSKFYHLSPFSSCQLTQDLVT
nr:hypothetical protein Iba_chr12fCG19960 [Ipomoea batatas]